MRSIVGCMTGTSIDALDAALVHVEGEGESMRASFVRGCSLPLGELEVRLRRMAEQQPMTAGDIAHLMRDFSLLHARAVREVLAGELCDLICVHGQTVYHQPPVSWQLFQPGPLVEACGVPVIYDLRQADLARGGQGAPITPIADMVLFLGMHARAWEHPGDAGQTGHARTTWHADAVLNLGGFCNATHRSGRRDPWSWHEEAVHGADICACNHQLDFIAREYFRMPFDRDGLEALAGTPHSTMLREWALTLEHQARQGRSLGTGDELFTMIRRFSQRLSPRDLAATACAAIAATIRHVLPASVERVLVAGGGVKNAALMRELRARFARCETTAAFGVPPEFREAACFAVLGALSQDGVSIYFRPGGNTRTPPPIAGVWAGLGG